MVAKRKIKKEAFLILSTAPTKQEAEYLAKNLLKQKLAACINVIYPVKSFFPWKGKNESVKEALLIIKTTAPQFSKIEKFFQKFHSYEVPELIGWPLKKASSVYVNWLHNSIQQ